MVEEYSSAWVMPAAVREKVDEFLNEPGLVPVDALRRAKRVDAEQLRASWGLSPEAIAGQRAAMQLTGGLPPRGRGGR